MTWHDRTAHALWSWDPNQDPRDAEAPSQSVQYRCIEPGCDWQGTSGDAATEHHRESRHHQIVNLLGMRAHFSCCAELL